MLVRIGKVTIDAKSLRGGGFLWWWIEKPAPCLGYPFHESLVKDFGAAVLRRSLLGEFEGGAFRGRLMKLFFMRVL